ncbi:MAG: DUF927 domain-containing protein, partial [Candidatus Saccharimonadales bacterium]
PSWGLKAVVSAGQGHKDQLREAIQRLSTDVPRETVFVHHGWRRIETNWCYRHANGCLGRDDVQVEPDQVLRRYALPTAPVTDDQTRAAILASLKILDIAPHRVTVPLYSATWLAPLAMILRPTFAMWPYGATGALKSTVAALICSHFGTFTVDCPPITWSATSNAIERALAIARDLLLWCDNVRPDDSRTGQRELAAKIQTVLHAIGDGQGRARLRSDTSSRATYTPAGLIISTAELFPTGASTIARAFPVKMEHGDVQLDKLTACQAETSQYPIAMSGYLRWLAPQMDQLRATLPADRDTLRVKAYQQGAHLRAPEQVATLALGFGTFLRYAVEVGALTESAADDLTADAWESL